VTFSVVARSPDSSHFGVAIASSSPAVAARCAHARAGVGAVASQNITDPRLGQQVLDGLTRGGRTDEALNETLRATPFAAYRQVLAIGVTGAPVIHSGSHALGVVGSATGTDAAAAGNMLAHEDVPKAMVEAFATTRGHLGARLLQALLAGLERGGEAGPVHSAGLLIVREVSWPIVDLRVDWTPGDPVAELLAAWQVYLPQIDDYVRRALDPAAAPRFGVPGDP
jgi:uncharacterized Ntn-hydrolase superfamily protein